MEITKEGKIFENGIECKPHVRKDSCNVISINNKLQYVHRLVAEKYIPNPQNKKTVNHKDGNRSNNHVDNLEWVTRRENCEHARLNGLSEKKSQGIKDLTYEQYLEMFKLRGQGMSYRKISEYIGRDHKTIWDIINGKRYKDYKKRMEEYHVSV
jgi:hypothetical protein